MISIYESFVKKGNCDKKPFSMEKVHFNQSRSTEDRTVQKFLSILIKSINANITLGMSC